MNSTVKPGEQIRLYCNDCLTEYEVLLEPKAKGEIGAGRMPPKCPEYCAFCGRPELEEV